MTRSRNLAKRWRLPRRGRVASARWLRRALFVMGGAVVGVAAVLLALWGDTAQRLFRDIIGPSRYIALAVTPVGFALAVWMTRRFFPNAQGSGIPQAIAARQIADPEQRGRLVSLRIALGKILLTLFGLMCGASTGREGPTVQVGASIMYAAGRLSPRRQAGLILAGSAAGVAAAFNTPLAGIVFAIEEMSRSFEVRTSGLIIGSIIVAGLVSVFFLGNYTYFGVTNAGIGSGAAWLAVPLCGVLGGLAGGGFSRAVVTMARGLPNRAGVWIKTHAVGFAALCGLAVALCGLASGDATYGTGYHQVEQLLSGHAVPSWGFGPLKLVATALSSISGIPGGIFSPSLAVGAGLGYDLSLLFPAQVTGAVVLLGMVAYFAGVTQAPITAFVIVTEMTGSHDMLLPLMASAAVAHGASRLICREGIYHALSHGFIAAAKPKAELSTEGSESR